MPEGYVSVITVTLILRLRIMPPALVILAFAVNRDVTHGFVPAAIRTGCQVYLLSPEAGDYKANLTAFPGAELTVLQADTGNPISVIDAILNLKIEPKIVMSNSDHIQASTAIVAKYFHCPAKPWDVCYQAKNKAEMRKRLEKLNLPAPWYCEIDASVPSNISIPYPVVAKPREGVASLNVEICYTEKELKSYLSRADQRSPILLESYLSGALFSVETLSDGDEIIAVGGFDVEISSPPYCCELSAKWNGSVCAEYKNEALEQIKSFGIGLGVCHSEFILTPAEPVLVEINYRSAGDGKAFLLDKILSFGWFEKIIKLRAGEVLGDINTVTQAGLIQFVCAQTSGILKKVPRLPLPVTFDFDSDVDCELISLKQKEEEIHLTNSNKDYIAQVLITGRTNKIAETAVKEIKSKLSWEII